MVYCCVWVDHRCKGDKLQEAFIICVLANDEATQDTFYRSIED